MEITISNLKEFISNNNIPDDTIIATIDKKNGTGNFATSISYNIINDDKSGVLFIGK